MLLLQYSHFHRHFTYLCQCNLVSHTLLESCFLPLSPAIFSIGFNCLIEINFKGFTRWGYCLELKISMSQFRLVDFLWFGKAIWILVQIVVFEWDNRWSCQFLVIMVSPYDVLVVVCRGWNNFRVIHRVSDRGERGGVGKSKDFILPGLEA